MASPKSGKGGSAVSPAAPAEAADADVADPGEVSEAKAAALESEKGKYAPVKTTPFKPPTPEEAEVKNSWIEIELIDEADQPVVGEEYRVTLPDGTTVMPLSSRIDKNARYASAAVTLVGAYTVALMLRLLLGNIKRLPVMLEINRTRSGKSASSRLKATRALGERGL